MAFLGAVIIGLTLGMLGSGGSAITVPVLIYLVGHGTKESIAESMAIVGLISIVAAIPYARAHQIDWHSVWWFGIPGMIGTLIGAWLGGLAAEALQLIVFGAVLLLAAFMMLRKPRSSAETEHVPKTGVAWRTGLEGVIVGMVTGFVGVGGGFLIVPALVVLGRLPMRLAIGTSLVIISIKAAVGFAKYEHYLMHHDLSVDPMTIVVFAVLGAAGSIFGRSINRRLNQAKLRRVFAGFLLVLGSFVVVQQGGKLWPPAAASRTAPPHSAAHRKTSSLIDEQPNLRSDLEYVRMQATSEHTACPLGRLVDHETLDG